MRVRMNRRDCLRTMGAGFGMLGLADLLGATTSGVASPLAPKAPHFTPKAKRVVFVFLNGGPSQVDTFDPKPALAKYAGQPMPSGDDISICSILRSRCMWPCSAMTSMNESGRAGWHSG